MMMEKQDDKNKAIPQSDSRPQKRSKDGEQRTTCPMCR